MGGFQFDEDQRQAVDEAHQVGAALVDLAGDPELGGEEEIVVGGGGPVDDLDAGEALDAFRVAVADPHAVLEQFVHLAVGFGGWEDAAVAGQFFDGKLQGRFRQVWVEAAQGGQQARNEDHLVGGLTSQAAVCAEGFIEAVGSLPADC